MKYCSIVTGALLLAGVTACSSSNPAQPTTSGGSSSVPNVTLVAPRAVTPPANAQILYTSQPVTLTVTNGLSTGTAPVTYTFEVATDTAFSNIVYSKTGVAPGTSQTSQALGTLNGPTTYYWRSRVVTGSSAGPNSTAQSFAVGPPVTLQAPVLVSPAANATATGMVTLVVNNAARTGPAGPLTYKFDIANSSAFTTIVYTTTVTEGAGGQTSVAVPNNTLTSGNMYDWRVEAIDATDNVTSPYASASVFTFNSFNMAAAAIYDSPPDLGSWPQTANITLADTSGEFTIVDFDRRDGQNRWPDQPFGDGTIEYTLGMCLNINKQWDCSAAILFWYGRELTAGGGNADIGINWFYDARWGPMLGYQPSAGETIGLFVGAGPLRDVTQPSSVYCPVLCERSNVALVPFGSTYTLASLVKSLRLQVTPSLRAPIPLMPKR